MDMEDSIQVPEFVAEISCNHGGTINQAFKIIDAAIEAGADSVKIQTYEPSDMTVNRSDSLFQINHGPWIGRSYWSLYEEAYTPYDWQAKLFEYASSKGIQIFSSPFSVRGVDLLERLDVQRYKIASFEFNHVALLSEVAQTGKPIILSTGACGFGQIERALEIIQKYSNGPRDIVLLHCISQYPSSTNDADLRRFERLKAEFGLPVGLSDHSATSAVAITAAVLGCRMIEKHLKLNETSSPDDFFSLTPQKFLEMTNSIRGIAEALAVKDEQLMNWKIDRSHPYARSLFYSRDLSAGTILTENHFEILRPNLGMDPFKMSSLIGRKLNKRVSYGDPVKLEQVN